MAPRRKRYQAMEQMMTVSLLADAALFLVYLLAAGFGVAWLKVCSAIVAILLSVLSLTYLFLTRELLRARSMWLSTGFAAVIVCIVVSLLCNYPSPSELKPVVDGMNQAAVGIILLP